MTPTPIEAAVQRWVASVITPALAVFADQPGPRPAKPYATIKTVADVTPGEPDWIPTERDAGGGKVEVDIVTRHRATVSVQCFGDAHETMARDIWLSIWEPDIALALAADDLTVQSVVTRPRRVIVPRDTTIETRSLLEVLVAMGDTRVAAVDAIETLTSTPTFQPPE